jgi:hypothetical protein
MLICGKKIYHRAAWNIIKKPFRPFFICSANTFQKDVFSKYSWLIIFETKNFFLKTLKPNLQGQAKRCNFVILLGKHPSIAGTF